MRKVVHIDGRYTLEEELGTGSYATVYCAQDIITKQVIAIELEPIVDKAASHLEHKYMVLDQLLGGTGLPQPLWFGREGLYCIMVLNYLSPSLDEVVQVSPDGGLVLGHVAELGLQMISCLKYIYSHNFVHHDIKPQNILMGTSKCKDIPFLINFGITKLYHNPSSCIHIPMQESYQLIGTLVFTLINSHLGHELSWRDDLEALMYTLMFLFGGSLPWLTQCSQCHLPLTSIQKMKELLGARCLPEVPIELSSFLSYAHNLSFMQKLDYDYL
ncbi:kinase-like domain-containing protein [Pisolithus marmoratus]|nr:kinase-like domain-containing protein [Pisolithus marmoratus]